MIDASLRIIARLGALAAVRYESRRRPQIIESPQIGHSHWPDYLKANFNKPGMKILEIGSRVVTGSNYRLLFDRAEYVGVDILPGANVDHVIDAHDLSASFDHGSFDLVFSTAVFEHLVMPWVVAEEIAKVLKINGHVFVETHFSFSSHERPWNFFQFSDMGLKCLFNPGIGFQPIEAGMSDPIKGWYASQASPYLRYREVGELYCHSQILAKKISNTLPVSWRDISRKDLNGGTMYPNS